MLADYCKATPLSRPLTAIVLRQSIVVGLREGNVTDM